MRGRVIPLLLLLLSAVPVFAQANQPSPVQFTVQAKAIGQFSNNQEIAATDAVAILGLTPRVSIRSDNIVTPDGQAYFNGVQYILPGFTKLAAKTALPQHFQFYAVAQIGVARNTKSQALGGSAGGGVNYDPSGQGHFALNLLEVRWASKLPGVDAIKSGTVVSSGLSITF